MTSPASRRAEALALAEELLSDIELSAIAPIDVARKASRLARLLDDTDAMAWLRCEVGGYSNLDPDETAAATRSQSHGRPEPENPAGTKGPSFFTGSLGQLAVGIEASKARLSAADTPIERKVVVESISQQQGILDAVVGAIHSYVADRYQELRFGSGSRDGVRGRSAGG